MNGDKNGAYFNSDCSGSNWKFGISPIKSYTFARDNNDYKKQLINIGQTDNLPSQNKKQKQTINVLTDILDKINYSTNNKESISKDRVSQLQEILNQLQNSNN
jgi:hypothetical protein